MSSRFVASVIASTTSAYSRTVERGRFAKRRPRSLQARVAVFVSLSIFGGATLLFSITVIASRSWVGAEQQRLLETDATGHVRLMETTKLDAGDLDTVLEALHPETLAAVELGSRWFGAPRGAFVGIVDARVNAEIDQSRLVYRADATDTLSLIALPINVAGTKGRYYELADHSAWDQRRARTRRILVLSSLVLAVLAASAGVIAGRRFSRPLTDAATAARRIAEGGLDTRLPETDDPALADLTKTFNNMAEALATRLESDRRFNSDVSHELRSPLTTLVASLAVLQSRRHELSPANRTALDLLDADLHRFTRLVDDLLEMSRFDANVATLLVNKVNVSEFLEAAAAATGRFDLNLAMSPMLRVFEIELDKRRIARVITNLIDNAYAHGNPPVWLRAVEIPPGDTSPTHVKISIEDRGSGVDLDHADELFERFNRGPRQGRSNGSGLGLALAREHVHLHGGTISFEPLSRGVRGTCIAVVLPIRRTPRGPELP